MNLHSCCCSSPLFPLPICCPPKHAHFCFLSPTMAKQPLLFNSLVSRDFLAAAKSQVSSSPEEGKLASELLDDQLLDRVSAAKDAAEVLSLISEDRRTGGVLTAFDCRLIILAALDRGNADLALSVFYAMRSSFDSGPGWVENATSVERLKWSRPDVHTCTMLVKGLAASLRVSDALRMIDCVCRVGVSPGEDVPFGKVVRCPSCMIAVAVAQPQQGIQLVSCSKCRYQYELVSGNILTIDSEEVRISSCRTQHGCPCLGTWAAVLADIEAKHSSCCSFYCGGDPIWRGKNSQVCH